MSTENQSKLSAAVYFTSKSYWQHAKDFFVTYTVPLAITSGAAFGVFIALFEASVKFNSIEPNRWAYLWVIGASVIVAIIWQIYKYLNVVPEGFDSASRYACRVAHLQPPRWQFHLAKILLAEMLGPYDRELKDIKEGNYFVIGSKPKTFNDYFHCLQDCPTNLLIMSDATKQVIVGDFARALLSSTEKPVKPLDVLYATITLASVYSEIVAFERSIRAVVSSENLRKLHEMMFNWSDSIRDAIHQVFKYLQLMIECQKNTTVSFSLDFYLPKQVEEFHEELARLRSPEILARLESEW